MKCISCSGVSPEGSKFCQFCGGTSFAVQDVHEASPRSSNINVAGTSSHDDHNKFAEFVESILTIKTRTVNKFRWLPFLFNVSYLAGYGNTKEANRTIGILLGGYVAVWILIFLGQIGLARVFFYGTLLFGIYYCYLISTRIDALVRRERPFNWPVAIGYWALYMVASAILTSRL